MVIRSYVVFVLSVLLCGLVSCSAGRLGGAGSTSAVFKRSLGASVVCPPPFESTDVSAANGSDIPDSGLLTVKRATCRVGSNKDNVFLTEVYVYSDPDRAKEVFLDENDSRGNCSLGDLCQMGSGFLFFVKGCNYVKIIPYFPAKVDPAKMKTLAEQLLKRL